MSSDPKTHVSAIAAFLRHHNWLWRAHVVDFFHVRTIPSSCSGFRVSGLTHRGFCRGSYGSAWTSSGTGPCEPRLWRACCCFLLEEWPDSLKEFVDTAFRLSLSRRDGSGSEELEVSCYSGVAQAPISSVLGQGMSAKKLHEIGILAAVIAGTAKARGAQDVIDVGAGQGYLALVLAFEYRLSVIAVDACAHHAHVTNKRALRIQKYYNAQSRKTQQEGLKCREARAPHTITCRVGTGEPLSSLLPAIQESCSSEAQRVALNDCRVVLAGLHACGDLSATMLRTFIACKEVASVINVGCCYNLLSDDETSCNDRKEPHGFPMSETVAKLGLHLGRSARDLACQSADRWKDHHPTRAVQNFELHAFRAAFQLVLERYYPATAASSPSVGRGGKSRRRRQARQSALEPSPDTPSNDDEFFESAEALEDASSNSRPEQIKEESHGCEVEEQAARFEEYARLALERLELLPLSSSVLRSVWREVAPDQDLVGPFYSLRAVLAPVIESYILLDRLLYLKEQAEVVAGEERISAQLVPLFDPSISPRNMAIIAHRG